MLRASDGDVRGITLAAWMQDSWHQLERWTNQGVIRIGNRATLLAAHKACVTQALRRSESLAYEQIVADFRELDIQQIAGELIAVLRECLIVMLTTTGIGALLGGVVGGVFTLGAGAIPGAAVGAALGAEAGEWILMILGLKAIIEFVIQDLPAIGRIYWDGIREAWFAATPPPLPQQQPQINQLAIAHSAQMIARGHVAAVVLLLVGIVAYLSKGRGSMSELAAKASRGEAGAEVCGVAGQE